MLQKRKYIQDVGDQPMGSQLLSPAFDLHSALESIDRTGRMTETQNDGKPTGMVERLRHRPLFLRIFLVMLSVVLGAQILNFAIILMVKLPAPSVYSTADIGLALREGRATGALKVVTGQPPEVSSLDHRDLQVRALLARRLGVPESSLRIRISRPPLISGWKGMHDNEPLRDREIAGYHSGKEGEGGGDIVTGRFVAALQLPDGSWRLATPKGGWVETWQWMALLWLVGTFLLAAPFAWIMARRAAMPIDMFSAAAERIGRNPGAEPLRLDAPTELKPAILALNDMQARLKRLVDDRTTLVASIAHDLKTPLMRLYLLLDNAPDSVRSSAEAEICEMSERINTALSFVKGINTPIERKRLNLRTLIESVANDLEDNGYDVDVASGPDVTVEANVAGLRALLANVVENALRYAGDAHLELRSDSTHAIVQVTDTGPGIPETELERVFEPFYRLETSRSRTTGGMGLGLASARAVARAHGGDLILRNRPEGGLIAELSLPKAPQP